MGELGLRTVSAAVILPIAAAAIWRGGWAFDLLILAAVLAMLWEWRRIVRRFPAAGRLAAGLIGSAVILAAGAAAQSMRADPSGLERLVWLALIVTATDVGAYAFGRGIGGPKLAPRISPNKTWAGLLGGAGSAAAATAFAGMAAGAGSLLIPAASAACLGVVSQIGDLAESWSKRRAEVKDSGRLIPGHGGVLDRLDGYLAAAPALWLYHQAGGPALGWNMPAAPF
ncbi:MAG: phosphatidate cytidylyltransferase [Alphaproteobacteria bacterium]|nr:phosphatidate cytidylyltransferase [Alphaproteobacteria bacterium]